MTPTRKRELGDVGSPSGSIIKSSTSFGLSKSRCHWLPEKAAPRATAAASSIPSSRVLYTLGSARFAVFGVLEGFVHLCLARLHFKCKLATAGAQTVVGQNYLQQPRSSALIREQMLHLLHALAPVQPQLLWQHHDVLVVRLFDPDQVVVSVTW
eukprot:7386550-Prymnesium_polylepis.2